jgi:UDP-glucose 4-epimerase
MSSETVLVTGGFGFLGRAVARRFKGMGFQVIGIGRGHWSLEEAQRHGFDAWLDAGVTPSSLMSLNERFDVIVHCAGNGSVGYSLTNPLEDFNKTVSSTADLLEYMRLSRSQALLIYPSSAGVYGSRPDAPIRESDQLNPISPYGFHKRMCEELLTMHAGCFGVKTAIIRFFSIYGPGLTKQLLWDASVKLLGAAPAVFWGTGEETRDWIFIDDAVELITHVYKSAPEFVVLNGASGNRTTIKDTIQQLSAALGIATAFDFNEVVREGDPRFYHADISKSVALGWKPRFSLTDGIERYVNWLAYYDKRAFSDRPH